MRFLSFSRHPHIRDNCLCEGERQLPIRRALEEGRWGDFFQIVGQILTTYNAGSAYVPLEEWEGMSCTACGMSVDEEERTNCARTGETLTNLKVSVIGLGAVSRQVALQLAAIGVRQL